MTDFREFLREDLARRCKVNPKYSLRAYARYLAVEPSYLSKLLRGARPVTSKKIIQFSKRIGLGPKETEGFLVGKRLSMGDQAAPGRASLTYDQFQLISEWYHFALLELVDVKSFRSSPRWIARALAISEAEAQVAVERLLRLGLLERSSRGKLVATGDVTTVGSADTAIALRALQKRILEQAIAALDEVPAERRDQSAMTMAVPLSAIPQAKERIKKFRREFCDFVQALGSHEEVYQLSIGFFPVSKAKEIPGGSQ